MKLTTVFFVISLALGSQAVPVPELAEGHLSVLSIRDAIAIEDLVSKRNDAATAKWGFNWQFSPVKDPSTQTSKRSNAVDTKAEKWEFSPWKFSPWKTKRMEGVDAKAEKWAFSPWKFSPWKTKRSEAVDAKAEKWAFSPWKFSPWKTKRSDGPIGPQEGEAAKWGFDWAFKPEQDEVPSAAKRDEITQRTEGSLAGFAEFNDIA